MDFVLSEFNIKQYTTTTTTIHHCYLVLK